MVADLGGDARLGRWAWGSDMDPSFFLLARDRPPRPHLIRLLNDVTNVTAGYFDTSDQRFVPAPHRGDRRQ